MRRTSHFKNLTTADCCPLEIIYGPSWVLFAFVCLFVPHNPQKRKGRFRKGKRLARAYTARVCCRLETDVNVSRSRAVPVFNHCAVPTEVHGSHDASDGERRMMVKISTGKCVQAWSTALSILLVVCPTRRLSFGPIQSLYFLPLIQVVLASYS